MASVGSSLDSLLGLHVPSSELGFVPITVRTLCVFLVGLLLVRWGARRFMGRNSGFDFLVTIVLGSVLSRGINGQASFFPTLWACALLVMLHEAVSVLACRYHRVSRAVKGTAELVVRDGRTDERALRAAKLSHDDLFENLRMNGNVGKPADVAEAWFERNGSISVIRKPR
jgi:uncharacterized membrane protein YcaP (DUF421 family)